MIFNILSSLSEIDAFTVASKENDRDIKGWIASDEFIPIISNNIIELQPVPLETYDIALANDILRNGYLCAETIHNLRGIPNTNRTAAWLAVKTYYAAFFAAHTFMRIFGQTCSYLDNNVTHICNRHIKKYAGNQYCKINAGLNKTSRIKKDRICITPLRDSHKDTWSILIELIDILMDKISNTSYPQSDKTECISHLISLKNSIYLGDTTRPIPWAMSELRNNINYRGGYRIWHPNQRTAQNFIDTLDSNIRSLCAKNISAVMPREKLDRFIFASILLVRLVVDLVETNTKRANTKNSKLARLNARFQQIL